MKRGNLSPNNDLYCGYDYSSADTLTTDRGDRTVRTGRRLYAKTHRRRRPHRPTITTALEQWRAWGRDE